MTEGDKEKLNKRYMKETTNENKKAIIKKNDNGTYKIIDLNGNDYIIHYKIGETEYKNEFMKNLSWSDIQDIIFMFHIEFVNFEEIKKDFSYKT